MRNVPSPNVAAMLRVDEYLLAKRPNLPIKDKEGGYPIVAAFPDDRFADLLERLSWLSSGANLIIAYPHRFEVFGVTPAEQSNSEPIVVTPDNPRTVGEVAKDLSDLKEMDGPSASLTFALDAAGTVKRAQLRTPEYV